MSSVKQTVITEIQLFHDSLFNKAEQLAKEKIRKKNPEKEPVVPNIKTRLIWDIIQSARLEIIDRIIELYSIKTTYGKIDFIKLRHDPLVTQATLCLPNELKRKVRMMVWEDLTNELRPVEIQWLRIKLNIDKIWLSV